MDAKNGYYYRQDDADEDDEDLAQRGQQLSRRIQQHLSRVYLHVGATVASAAGANALALVGVLPSQPHVLLAFLVSMALLAGIRHVPAGTHMRRS